MFRALDVMKILPDAAGAVNRKMLPLWGGGGGPALFKALKVSVPLSAPAETSV